MTVINSCFLHMHAFVKHNLNINVCCVLDTINVEIVVYMQSAIEN